MTARLAGSWFRFLIGVAGLAQLLACGKVTVAKDDDGGPDVVRDPVTKDADVEVVVDKNNPAVCTMGTRMCVANVPQTCDATGQWQPGQACTFICSQGQCAGECIPTARQCSPTATNTPQTCGTDGRWHDGIACTNTCRDGTCGGACTQGTSRCADGMMQVCDPSGNWRTTGMATQQLLVNPDFDSGATGWTEMSQLPGGFVITNTTQVAPYSAPYLAWLGGYDSANDQVAQTVTIPAAAVSATLSFYYKVFTQEVTDFEFDKLDAVLATPDGNAVSVFHLSNMNPTSTWTQASVSLPGGNAGRTVVLRFAATTDVSNFSSFYVDSVSLDVVGCPAGAGTD